MSGRPEKPTTDKTLRDKNTDGKNVGWSQDIASSFSTKQLFLQFMLSVVL